jgi:YcxB-like protein
MNLEYRINAQDYQEAYRANYRSQQISYIALYVLSIVLVLIGLLYVVSPKEDGLIDLLLGTGLFGLGVCLIPDLYYRFFFVSFWRSPPYVREAVVLQVNPEGMVYHSDSVQATLKWHVYTHFVETRNLFLVYLSPQLYGVLPKRAFNDSTQMAQFRSLLRQTLDREQSRF